MEFNGQSPQSNEMQELLSKIEALERDYDAAQKQIINWQFERLEEQLAITQDALAEKEGREEERRIEAELLLQAKIAELEAIKIKFYADKDALIQEQKAKIDYNEKKNEERLDFFIQGKTTGDDPLPPSEEPWYKSIIFWVVVGVIIFVILVTILVVVLKKNKKPVYLKPVNPPSTKSNNSEGLQQQSITAANESNDVVRSELNSLRQSAVSMSVGQKEGATQIVKDWLEVDGEQNTENQE